MTLRLIIPKAFARTARNAESRDHGHLQLPQARLAWPQRSEGKDEPRAALLGGLGLLALLRRRRA